MFTRAVPAGMTRRHFMQHLAGSGGSCGPGDDVHQLGAGRRGRHAAEEQGRHPAVDGGWSQHDRLLGPETGCLDRR